MDNITLFNVASLAVMLIAGTLFSVWYARHEHIDVK